MLFSVQCSLESFVAYLQVEVNGPQRHPLYSYLMANLPASRNSGIRNQVSSVNWNFYKFLVDSRGQPYSVFD